MPAPIIAAGLAAFELVPTLLRLFGKERPAEVVEKVGTLAHQIAGTQSPEQAVSVLTANPELMVKFVAESEERALEWYKLHIQDVQSARERDTKMLQAGYRNIRAHTMYVLAVFIILLLVIIIWKSPDLNEYVKGIFTLVLGRFLGYLDSIYNFEFGTTRQSRAKDDVIDKLTKNGKS